MRADRASECFNTLRELLPCCFTAVLQVQYACMHRLMSSYSLRVLCCLLVACAASCACALVGTWLLHKALSAHGLAGRHCGAAPLLLQVSYWAV
jgi:hypothetical protein